MIENIDDIENMSLQELDEEFSFQVDEKKVNVYTFTRCFTKTLLSATETNLLGGLWCVDQFVYEGNVIPMMKQAFECGQSKAITHNRVFCITREV